MNLLFRSARWCFFLSLVLLVFLVLVSSAAAQFHDPQTAIAGEIAGRIVGPVDTPKLVTLAGNTHPLANTENDRGAVPEDFPAERMILVLKRSAAQETALQSFLQSVENPASSQYHRYLTPTEFGAQFGLAESDLGVLKAWLRSLGFTVARTLSGRTGIEFSGTAGQVRASFHTAIHSYNTGGEQHYANSSDPQIPAALAGVVAGITLNNFAPRAMQTAPSHAVLDPVSHRAKMEAKPLFNDPGPGAYDCLSGYCFGVVPGDFATLYNTKPLLQSGVDGTGVKIGVVGIAAIDTSIVKRFRQNFLPGYSADNLPAQIVDGPFPTLFGSGDVIEAYLDVEETGAMAPNATINFYTAENTYVDNGVGLALARALDENQIDVLSVSFGECEAYLGTTYNAFYSDLFEQAVAQGITVLVSTGDTGSAACDPPPNTSGPTYSVSGLYVNGLASSPYSVAVGGTDFYYPAQATLSTLGQYWNTPTASDPGNNSDWSSAKGYIPEKPWNLSDPVLDQVNLSPSLQAGGGGKSNCIVYSGTTVDGQGPNPADCHGGYPQPEWQKGFTTDTVRDLPDVSLFASDGSNYSFVAVCAFSTDCAVPNAGPNSVSAPLAVTALGGTSVSAPVMAGIMALVVDKTQSRQGQANAALYPLSRQVPQAFHDVTVGTIAVDCIAGTYNCGADGYLTGYSATEGYDLATGLGSVDAAELVNHWSQVTFTGTATTLTVSPTTAVHGTALTLTVNVSAGGGSAPVGGDVAIFATRATGDAQGVYQTTCAAFPCTFTYSELPGGKYEVSARYAGSSVYAASTSAGVPVEIAPENSQLGVYYEVGDAYVNGAINQVMNLNGQMDLVYGGIITFTVLPAPADQPLPATPAQLTATPATGTLQIYDFGKVLGAPLVLDSTGKVFFEDFDLSVGKHSLTVQYSGDASYNPSSTVSPTSTPLNFTIGPTPDTLYLSPFYQQVLPGNGTTVTATIATEGLAGPTGTVTFTVYSASGKTTVLPQVTLKYDAAEYSSVAVVNIPASALAAGPATMSQAGNNSVTAAYSGDINYLPSVQQAAASIYDAVMPTNIFLYSTPAAPAAGETTAITARVGWSNTLSIPGYPGGDVTFLDGTTKLATVATKPDAYGNGIATLNTAKLAVGTHKIAANYAGDAQFDASTATITVVVSPAPPPTLDFTLTATPVVFAAGEISPSQTSTLTLKLNFAPTDTSNFTLSCAAPPQPSAIRCSVLPTASIPAGATETTSAVKVSIEGKTASAATGPERGWMAAAGGLAAALLLPFGLRTRRRKLFGLLLLVALGSALATVLTGCQVLHYNSLAAGSYDVTVTAKLGSTTHLTSVPVKIE